MEITSIVAGLVSVALGLLALWLSIHFYQQAKQSEKELAVLLEGIKSQTGLLNEITLKQLDKYTEYFTKAKPQYEEALAMALQANRWVPVDSKGITESTDKQINDQEIDDQTLDALAFALNYACWTNFLMRVIHHIGTQTGFRRLDQNTQQRIEEEINRSYGLINDLFPILKAARAAGRLKHSAQLYDVAVKNMLPITGRADQPLRGKTEN